MGKTFSPDCGLPHMFGSEVIALDADWLEGLYRWQLSLVGARDLGRLSFSFQVDRDEEPGYFARLFRVGTRCRTGV